MKILVVALLLAVQCVAQTADKKQDGPPAFKADIVVKEFEAGKLVSSRNYTLALTTEGPASIRTGDKVPVPTGKDGSFTFLDVGVNIDCRDVRMRGTDLVMQLAADISSFVGSTGTPTINQTKWMGPIVVPMRKPTIVFTADGASTKRQMQVEITATPIP